MILILTKNTYRMVNQLESCRTLSNHFGIDEWKVLIRSPTVLMYNRRWIRLHHFIYVLSPAKTCNIINRHLKLTISKCSTHWRRTRPYIPKNNNGIIRIGYLRTVSGSVTIRPSIVICNQKPSNQQTKLKRKNPSHGISSDLPFLDSLYPAVQCVGVKRANS